jgi:hypothetical protein
MVRAFSISDFLSRYVSISDLQHHVKLVKSVSRIHHGASSVNRYLELGHGWLTHPKAIDYGGPHAAGPDPGPLFLVE